MSVLKSLFVDRVLSKVQIIGFVGEDLKPALRQKIALDAQKRAGFKPAPTKKEIFYDF